MMLMSVALKRETYRRTVRCDNVSACAPDNRKRRLRPEVRIHIRKYNAYIRVNALLGYVFQTGRHISAAPRIKTKRELFTTLKRVVPLHAGVDVEHMHTLRRALLDDALEVAVVVVKLPL